MVSIQIHIQKPIEKTTRHNERIYMKITSNFVKAYRYQGGERKFIVFSEEPPSVLKFYSGKVKKVLERSSMSNDSK